MKKILSFAFLIWLMLSSCTKEKTKFEEVVTAQARTTYAQVLSVQSSGVQWNLYAQGGELRSGYNPIELRPIVQQPSAASIEQIKIRSLCPTGAAQGPNCGAFTTSLRYDATKGAYTGHLLFPKSPQSAVGAFSLVLSYQMNHSPQTAHFPLEVKPLEKQHTNRNHITFVAKDSLTYFLALAEPQRPQEGKNELLALLYQYNPHTAYYEIANDYKLLLDPRMPEPSMGNHSSPHNEHLMQVEGGFYRGVVNYTMTGDWTLNFILQNPQGEVIKGSEVPQKETPGVWGQKSELYLDIVF